MQRIALACCAVVACNSSDKFAPPPAPRELPAPRDAGSLDGATASSCFALPFDASAERAGIRPIAHHASHVETDVLLAVPKGATRLDPGKPSLITGVQPPLSVPPIGADAIVTMAKATGKGVEVTAPAFLEGAVIALTAGDQSTLLATGNTGLLALARYRDHVVTPRLATPTTNGYDVSSLRPLWIIADDVDGDGTLELVALSAVTVTLPEGGHQKKPVFDDAELDVLWASGALGFAPVRVAAPLYLVPPTLGGGKTLIVSAEGTRITIDGTTLSRLPDERPLGATCLQTSATEPARLITPQQ